MRSGPALCRLFLCLDDLEAGEILPFLLFQRIGDVFDGGGQAGQDNIFQRVGPFLGFVDRRGQTIDAVFHLGQLRREFFHLIEPDVRLVDKGAGIHEAVGQDENNEEYVYVADGARVERRTVKTGMELLEGVEVVEDGNDFELLF